ncbi:hypothetical protein DSECCO2_85460 [anaerobic digester metagenome]
MQINYRIFPFHPFFFVIFLIISIFTINLKILSFTALLAPIFFFFITILFILIISVLLKREYKKIGIIITFFLIMNYLYFPMTEYISSFFPLTLLFQLYGLIFIISIVLIIICIWIVYHGQFSFIQSLTKFLNVITFFLLIICVANFIFINFSVIWVNDSSSSMNIPDNYITQDIAPSKLNQRDFYFIIIDRYPGSETLQEIYNFNNNQFISNLSKHGFHVINNSRSNYGQTGLSLPSILNMAYLHSSKISDKEIEDNNILKFFNMMNYTTIHISSNWITTQNNANADVVINQYGSDMKKIKSKMLEESIWKITLIDRTLSYQFYYVIRVYLLGLPRPSSSIKEIDKIVQKAGIEDTDKFIRGTFANISLISTNPNNTYSFAHINGWEGLSDDQNNHTYIEKILSVNDIIIKTIDDILSNSDPDPVIIIISDHGIKPNINQIENHKDFLKNWSCIPNYSINEGYITNMDYLTNNFQALYLPSGGNDKIYSNITPVNIFRIVFNYYFNSSFEILDDKSFWKSRDGICEVVFNS